MSCDSWDHILEMEERLIRIEIMLRALVRNASMGVRVEVLEELAKMNTDPDDEEAFPNER